MVGNMWVESELSRGSTFYFTLSSTVAHAPLDATVQKVQPFANRTILFVDTLYDTTGVLDRIQELGLRSFVVHGAQEVANKDRCPHIDTIVVDSLEVVSTLHSSEVAVDIMLTCAFRCRPKTFASMSICGTSRSCSLRQHWLA
jgi:osomolarity two-component system sensor histidine kinase NIK1